MPTIINMPIGLPPIAAANISPFNHEDLVRDSMQIVELTPCNPTFHISLQGYRLEDAMNTYITDLSRLGGYTLQGDSPKLTIAVLAENPPSETFNNTFGESLMAKAVNIGSDLTSEVRFRTGKNATQLADFLQKQGGMVGAAGNIAEAGIGAGRSAVEGLGSAMNASDAQKQTMANTMENVLSGSKIDFAQIWKAADFSPGYSCTVRLYNPYPGDIGAQENRIIGPLAALLLFIIPRSTDGQAYTWPYMCKFRIPGMVQTFAGYVRSMSVIKGGDDYLIAYNQRPSIIDVKIDFGIIYSVMLDQVSGAVDPADIPSLSKYLAELRQGKTITPSSYTVNFTGAEGDSFNQPDAAESNSTPRSSTEGDRDSTPSRAPDTKVASADMLNNDFKSQATQGTALLNDSKSNISAATDSMTSAQSYLQNTSPDKFIPTQYKAKIDTAKLEANNALSSITMAKSMSDNIENTSYLNIQARDFAHQSTTFSELARQNLLLSGDDMNSAIYAGTPAEKLSFIESAKILLASSDTNVDQSINKLSQASAKL